MIIEPRDQFEMVDDDQSDLNDWYNQSQDGSRANVPTVPLTGMSERDRLNRAAKAVAGTLDVHMMSIDIGSLKEFMSDQDRNIRELHNSLNAQIQSVQSDLENQMNSASQEQLGAERLEVILLEAIWLHACWLILAWMLLLSGTVVWRSAAKMEVEVVTEEAQ